MLVNLAQAVCTPVAAAFGVAPFRLSGAVYVALLNDPAQLLALGDAVHQAPYKSAPKAPVLGVKPRNTVCGPGSVVGVPSEPGAVLVGASLGIVKARTAGRLHAGNALQHVAGYLVAADLSLPLSSHYRPAARARVRDGFCPMGSVIPAAAVAAPDDLAVTVHIDGRLCSQGSTAGRVRSVAQLLADVTEFMTLAPGDVLLLGSGHGMPTARAGQSVDIAISGVGALAFTLVAEAATVANALAQAA